MFKFKENTKSHMPFVAHGNAPDFEPKLFCCLMINGKWKLHHFENDEWKRIATGLSENGTECSPTAEYDGGNNKWKVSFIAGGFEKDRTFYLYKIEDLENSNLEKIIAADVGFVWKNKVVHGGRKGALHICNGEQILKLEFANVEYLYRVSYNPNNPNELLISGQFNGGELFSWILNPSAKTLYILSDNGESAYKAALSHTQCFYAKRGDSDDFEDRKIVEARNPLRLKLDFDSFVKIESKGTSLSNFQMAKNLANSAIKWAQSGFPLADSETLQHRKSICDDCEFWNADARLGFGKCLKCGCSSPKLKLASENCPLQKW